MDKIMILTDTACDLDFEDTKAMNIEMLPIICNIGGRDYREQLDIKKDRFLQYLENMDEGLPTTTQITHARWLEAFKDIYDNGYNKVICIPICSSGSGTFQSAVIASGMFTEKYGEVLDIRFIDAMTYSIGYGRLVLEAVKLRDEGVDFERIVEILNKKARQVEILFVPYTLDFARKSGRISCASALIGGVLGLKPIIHMVEGKSNISAKVRGNQAVIPKIVEMFKNNVVDPENQILDIAYGNIGDDHKKLAEALNSEFGGRLQFRFSKFGSSISLNAGPVTLGISYYAKER